MFKKIALAMLFIAVTVSGEPFSKMATLKPVLVQDGAKKMWCGVCGMNLKMFYKTSYIAGDKQYCSVRCLVADMQNSAPNLDKVQVIDVKTQQPILAKDANFVVGSDVKGTMSRVSKLAFGNKADAEEFIKAHGGKLATFSEVLDMAKNSLERDTHMVSMKKEKMMYPMGNKLFAKKCSGKLNLTTYRAINELKSDIKAKNICNRLNEKQLQAVALYLWDTQRSGEDSNQSVTIEISKEDRCPVCGMFVYKYPRWVTQLKYRDGTKLSFDGVKDMMKFYFNSNKYGKYESLTQDKVSKVSVIDYYKQKVIDGKNAYYVIGSNINGPMGEELIPFQNRNDAENFLNDHNGKQIIKFDEINQKILAR